MILTGPEFADAIYEGIWEAYISGERVGVDHLMIGTNSVDVTLSRFFTKVSAARNPIGEGRAVIDPRWTTSMYTQNIEDRELTLYTDEFLLAKTRESFITTVPLRFGWSRYTFVQMYDGRSTMARLGIISHCTAGFGDIGYSQPWTLELRNLGNSPVILREGDRIGQISFHSVIGQVGEIYKGPYQRTDKYPTPPVIGKGRM